MSVWGSLPQSFPDGFCCIQHRDRSTASARILQNASLCRRVASSTAPGVRRVKRSLEGPGPGGPAARGRRGLCPLCWGSQRRAAVFWPGKGRGRSELMAVAEGWAWAGTRSPPFRRGPLPDIYQQNTKPTQCLRWPYAVRSRTGVVIRRSGRKNLTAQCTLFSRDSLLRRRAHGGFLLQTCAPDTLLLQVKYNHTGHYSLYF